MMQKRQPFFAEFTIRVLIPSLVAASGIAALLLYIINGIFNDTNRLDAEYAKRTAVAAVGSIRENLKSVLQDNAMWDDAVAHTYGLSNLDWMDGTWGAQSANGIYHHSSA